MTDRKKEFDTYVRNIETKRIDLDVRTLLMRKRRQQRLKLTLIPACSLLLAFFVSINTIPAFANSVSNIPFLKGIASLLYLGEGIEEALANDYYQEINETQRQRNVSVTIDAIMVDDYSYLVFYRITHDVLNQYRLRLEDIDGVSVSYNEEVENKANTSLHFSSPEKKDFHDFTFTIVLTNDKEQLRFPFALPLDEEQVAKTTEVPIHKTIKMANGALVNLERMTISPTQASLMTSANEKSKYYVRKIDYVFTGEEGKKTIPANIGGWGYVDEEQQFLIESKYFDLDAYSGIKITGFELIDKSHYEISYDTINNTLTNLSDNFYNIQIQKNKNTFTLTYRLHDYVGNTGDILRPAVEYESASFTRSDSQEYVEFQLEFTLKEEMDIIPLTNHDAIYVPYEMEIPIPKQAKSKAK